MKQEDLRRYIPYDAMGDYSFLNKEKKKEVKDEKLVKPQEEYPSKHR